MRPDFVPNAIAFVTDDDVHEPKLGIGASNAKLQLLIYFLSYSKSFVPIHALFFSFRDNVPICGRRETIRR